MLFIRRVMPLAALAALLAMVAGLVSVTTAATASDHLDAPGLSSPDGRGQLDINDVYAFEGRPGHTVLALTVAPASGTNTTFARGARNDYAIRLDFDGDAVEDRTYHFRTLFSIGREQLTVVRQSNGGAAKTQKPRGTFAGIGLTNHPFALNSGAKAFVGLRSDPFFFDLSGFLGTVEGQGEDALGQQPTDFFEDLNTLAIVLEIPDSDLNHGGQIGVWGTTSHRAKGKWSQVDRAGRPAINTVVNSSGPIVKAPKDAKNIFNDGQPVNDARDFTGAVTAALQSYSALDTEGAYSDVQANALAAVLLPDVLTYDKSSDLPAPLNGRALADDVIDTELRIVTGGDPLGLFDGRDADGGVNSDGVGPHDDYLQVFPYLGRPHR